MTQQPMTDMERFNACMEYQPADRRPNHEIAAWKQTMARWREEAPEEVAKLNFTWMRDEPYLGLDRREYVHVDYGYKPLFEEKVIEDLGDYEIIQNRKGIISKALKAGAIGTQRMSMNHYLSWPIKGPEDWPAVKARLVAAMPSRYPKDLDDKIAAWSTRTFPVCLGANCSANGFYWRAREFMGTENLSYAWYDYPNMMHEIMEFFADFIIEVSRPVLAKFKPDYFTFNEDMSMKNGPLLSPDTYRTFIFPHMRRLVDFFRGQGVRYIAMDTDGDPTKLVPLLMEAGVDTLWPIERASNVSPQGFRKQFGRGLRLWGGVDKRVLTQGPQKIRQHLLEMAPLIEEGGFIPTVDHAVPPDVSWDSFRYYMDAKRYLLAGDFGKLG